MSKVRVLPPVPNRGLMSLCMGAGIAYGLIAAAVYAEIQPRLSWTLWSRGYGWFVTLPLGLLAWYAVPALLAWQVARVCQKWGPVLLAGLGLGAAMYLGCTCLYLLYH